MMLFISCLLLWSVSPSFWECLVNYTVWEHLEWLVYKHFWVNIFSWLLGVVEGLDLVAIMVFCSPMLFRSPGLLNRLLWCKAISSLLCNFLSLSNPDLCLLCVEKLIVKSKIWKPVFSKGRSIITLKNVCVLLITVTVATVHTSLHLLSFLHLLIFIC